MSHAFDMINRIKMNQEIKGKRYSYPSSTISKDSTKYNFKQPTKEELKELAEKNRQFLLKQKRTNRIAFLVSLGFALVIMAWVFSWPWDDMMVGFMKGYGR